MDGKAAVAGKDGRHLGHNVRRADGGTAGSGLRAGELRTEGALGAVQHKDLGLRGRAARYVSRAYG